MLELKPFHTVNAQNPVIPLASTGPTDLMPMSQAGRLTTLPHLLDAAFNLCNPTPAHASLPSNSVKPQNQYHAAPPVTVNVTVEAAPPST